MTETTIGTAQKLSSPNPFGLLVTRSGGTENVMAVSWWTYLCNRPPMLAAALSKKGFSGDRITESGMFTLCLPTPAIKEAAFSCGTVSGRDVDKISRFGLEMHSLLPEYPSAILQSNVVFLCKLKQVVEVGDHNLYIAEAAHIFADANESHLCAYEGYASLQ